MPTAPMPTSFTVLQQYLPFTVLKLQNIWPLFLLSYMLQQYLPFTVLKLRQATNAQTHALLLVATVLTVYGIETNQGDNRRVASYQLQQYLPFTVLKLFSRMQSMILGLVATVLTVYGIETNQLDLLGYILLICCNSTYRLRY